ncbi:MAG TPA: hypothetical protein VGE60_06990 [Telluria sp.]
MNARIWMLPQGVLALVFLLYAIATLSGSSYDWDIDHMMYFGGRLLQGELVWTREFDDKLPLVQMLFALPAAAGSVKAWQALSIASVLVAALALGLALRRTLASDWDLAPDAARPLAWSASLLFLFLAAALPGSLSHINPVAASLLTLATLLLLARKPGRRMAFMAVPGTMLAPAVLASIAISLRPYLLAPALLAGLWSAMRTGTPLAGRRFVVLLDSATWAITLGATGLALNAAPYIISGEMTAFLDGLSLLGQQLNPQSLLANASVQARALYFGGDLVVFVVLAWVVFAAWVLSGVRRNHALLRHGTVRVDVLFAVVLSPLALELMILTKHFWPHYQQLFIPYAAVSMAFMLALLVRSPASGMATGVAGLLLVGAFLVLVRLDLSRSALGALRSHAVAHEREAERHAVERYLAQRGVRHAGFLNPGHMYLHWRMGEPRHGFPHAAHTLHIARDWWTKVRKPASLDLPVTRQEYCERLERQGPRFVVDRTDYWVLACFTMNPASRYRQAALLETGSGVRLAIFERLR